MGSPPVTDADPVVAVLGRPAARQLWLRLARGRPRTMDQIREIAPVGIDVVEVLTALDAAGLVRVGRDGLEIAHPVEVVADAAVRVLARHDRRLALTVDAADLSSADPGTHLSGEVLVDVRRGDHRDWQAVVATPAADEIGVVVPDVELVLDPATATDRQLLVPFVSGTNQVDVLRKAADKGLRLRILAQDPGRLCVGRRAATFGLDWGQGLVTALGTTVHPVLVALCRQVWAGWWDRAVPVPTGQGVGAILTLAAAGFDDEAVGELLGVGRRTIQRRLASVMDSAAVRSRFELGIRWAQGSLPLGVDGN